MLNNNWMLRFTHKKALKWVILFIGIYALFLLLIGIKWGYKTNNLFFDDGGVYVSELVALDNWSKFSNEQWFLEIKNNLTSEELQTKWGYHGPRILFIFSRGVRDGWLATLLIIKKITNFDYQEVFRVSMVLFAFVILLKYLLLLSFTRYITLEQLKFFPVVFSLIFVDFSQPYDHNYYWFVTSAYAYAFLTTGLILWFFYGEEKIVKYTSYFLMIVAASMSRIALPILFVILLSDIVFKYRITESFSKSILFLERYFVWILIGLIMATLPVAILYFYLFASHNFNYDLRLLSIRTGYIQLYIIALIFLLGALIKSESEKDKSLLFQKALFNNFLLILGTFCLVLISPFLDEETKHNIDRLSSYVYLMLIIGVGYIYFCNLSKKTILDQFHTTILLGLIICAFVTGIDRYSSPHLWKISQPIKLNSRWLPILKINKNGFQYYLARRPQQVYQYFMDHNYKIAPLILNINTTSYSVDNIINKLSAKEKK